MRLSHLKIAVVTFSLLVGSAVLYSLSSFSTVIFTDDETEQGFWRRDHLQLPSARFGDPPAQVERFIIILITSAPWHTNQRQAIRQTWLSFLVNNSVALGRSNLRAMKDPTNTSNTLVINYWFVCGHDKENKVELSLENEAQVYGDILRLNYTEKYSLLLYKTLNSLRFASTMDVKFIIKVDDDVYLHVPRLVWWLKTASLPGKLYAGQVFNHGKVIRKKPNKWHVSEHDYSETYFPPYCNGPFYILSKNVAVELLKASSGDRLSSFPIEDVYIGILAKRIGIIPIGLMRKGVFIIAKFSEIVEKSWTDYKLNKFFALGHGLSLQRLFAIHERFLKLPFISIPSYLKMAHLDHEKKLG